MRLVTSTRSASIARSLVEATTLTCGAPSNWARNSPLQGSTSAENDIIAVPTNGGDGMIDACPAH
jgi:hypothetical protein